MKKGSPPTCVNHTSDIWKAFLIQVADYDSDTLSFHNFLTNKYDLFSSKMKTIRFHAIKLLRIHSPWKISSFTIKAQTHKKTMYLFSFAQRKCIGTFHRNHELFMRMYRGVGVENVSLLHF